ncbi:hypothetical protein [Hyphomonas sp.]|uniref:hypothetical protein n=1 Tax=Hyphomonas sp. TaxID=87 RepID=UPI003919EAA1
MGWPNLPLDLRGPLGLVGAGLLAGAAALVTAGITGGGNSNQGAASVEAAVIGSSEMPAGSAEASEDGPIPLVEPAGDLASVEVIPPAIARPVIDPEPAPLSEVSPATRPPVALLSPQQAGGGPVSIPARAGMAEVVYIVRLRGAPEADLITRNFRRDPQAAYAAWADLIERVPELAEFELAGATYSGELRLLFRMPSATPAAVRAIQDRLLAIEGVAYADPDFIAHPGKEDTP